MFKEQKVVLHPNIVDLGNIRITIVNSVTISVQRQSVASLEILFSAVYILSGQIYTSLYFRPKDYENISQYMAQLPAGC